MQVTYNPETGEFWLVCDNRMDVGTNEDLLRKGFGERYLDSDSGYESLESFG